MSSCASKLIVSSSLEIANLRRNVEASRNNRTWRSPSLYVQFWPPAKREIAPAIAEVERAPRGPQTVPVGVATVKERDFPVYLTGLGSVLAFNTVSLKSRVDGQIMQVNFQEGQDVRKGDLLIVIDERPYQVALPPRKPTFSATKHNWQTPRRSMNATRRFTRAV